MKATPRRVHNSFPPHSLLPIRSLHINPLQIELHLHLHTSIIKRITTSISESSYLPIFSLRQQNHQPLRMPLSGCLYRPTEVCRSRDRSGPTVNLLYNLNLGARKTFGGEKPSRRRGSG